MKLINKNQVSHIVVFEEREGVWCSWGYWAKLIYLKGKPKSFWNEGVKEGYYENGRNSSFNMFRSKEAIEKKSNEVFVVGDSVWTRSFIQIFCGKSLIHEEYFVSYLELQKHLEENYSEINIKYK